MSLKIMKPFGPSILKVKIPDDIVKKLNDYVDNIIEDNKKSKNLNYGPKLAGDVTQEFILEQKFVNESGWLNFLGQCVQRWL